MMVRRGGAMMMRRGGAMMMRRRPAMMVRRGSAMMMRRGSAMMMRRGGASLIRGGRGSSPRVGWRGLGYSGTAVGFHGPEAGRRPRYMTRSEGRPLLERLLVTAAVGGRGQPSPRHLRKVQMLLLLLLLEGTAV
jgi:hypothetical protein